MDHHARIADKVNLQRSPVAEATAASWSVVLMPVTFLGVYQEGSVRCTGSSMMTLRLNKPFAQQFQDGSRTCDWPERAVSKMEAHEVGEAGRSNRSIPFACDDLLTEQAEPAGCRCAVEYAVIESKVQR